MKGRLMILSILFWAGSILRALSWIFMIENIIKNNGKVYHGVNLVGAMCISISAIALGQYEILVTFVAFAIFATFGLFRKNIILNFINLKFFMVFTISVFVFLNAIGYGMVSSLGFTGSSLIVLGYFLNANKSITINVFSLINITATVMFFPVLIMDENWGVMAMLIINTAFAIKYIIANYRSRKVLS